MDTCSQMVSHSSFSFGYPSKGDSNSSDSRRVTQVFPTGAADEKDGTRVRSRDRGSRVRGTRSTGSELLRLRRRSVGLSRGGDVVEHEDDAVEEADGRRLQGDLRNRLRCRVRMVAERLPRRLRLLRLQQVIGSRRVPHQGRVGLVQAWVCRLHHRRERLSAHDLGHGRLHDGRFKPVVFVDLRLRRHSLHRHGGLRLQQHRPTSERCHVSGGQPDDADVAQPHRSRVDAKIQHSELGFALHLRVPADDRGLDERRVLCRGCAFRLYATRYDAGSATISDSQHQSLNDKH
jgi:hypothetical protein